MTEDHHAVNCPIGVNYPAWLAMKSSEAKFSPHPGFTDFEWCVAMTFQEACNRFVNEARTKRQFSGEDKFLLASTAIQNAWPDIIARLHENDR